MTDTWTRCGYTCTRSHNPVDPTAPQIVRVLTGEGFALYMRAVDYDDLDDEAFKSIVEHKLDSLHRAVDGLVEEGLRRLDEYLNAPTGETDPDDCLPRRRNPRIGCERHHSGTWIHGQAARLPEMAQPMTTPPLNLADSVHRWLDQHGARREPLPPGLIAALTLRRHHDGSVTVLGPVPRYVDIAVDDFNDSPLLHFDSASGVLSMDVSPAPLRYKPIARLTHGVVTFERVD